MAGDYLSLVEQRLGVKFERVRNLSWQEAYARLKRWEIDMTTSVTVTTLKSIPVVVLTTSMGEREMMESYNLGANSYIVKPVGFEEFAKVIKDLKLYWLEVNSLPR